MIGWWILGWTLFIFVVVMTVIFCFKGREAMNQAQETASKVPGLKEVLGSKARTFDPEKDIECTECAICLVDFSVDDPKPLVELKCSNKHIFHLECMEGWIEQQ